MKKALFVSLIFVFCVTSTSFSVDLFYAGYDIPDEIPGFGVEVLKIYPDNSAKLGRIERDLIQWTETKDHGKRKISGFGDFDGERQVYKIRDYPFVYIPRYPEKIAGLER